MKKVDQLLSAASDLVAITSTADNPAGLRAAYEYMLALVRASGKNITIEEFEQDGRPSFLAYHGQVRPARFDLILNAHVDVVPGHPEQFRPYFKNGRLYGRGAYDMKAAAIVLAQVFCEYVDRAPYALGFQLVTNEEGGGTKGTLYQIQQGVRADLVICGECGRAEGTHEIANEAKGVAAVQVLFRGTVAHGAYPWHGDNAAVRAAAFVTSLYSSYPGPTEPTSLTTMTVTGLTSGGVVHNQVPDTATVNVDCRFAPDDTRFDSPETIAELFHSIDPEAEIVRYLSTGPPARARADHPLLRTLKAAAEAIEGHEFQMVRRNGASDGRFYTDVGGQAAEFGIAGSNQHADDEYITVEAFEDYLLTMRSFLEQTVAHTHAQHPVFDSKAHPLV